MLEVYSHEQKSQLSSKYDNYIVKTFRNNNTHSQFKHLCEENGFVIALWIYVETHSCRDGFIFCVMHNFGLRKYGRKLIVKRLRCEGAGRLHTLRLVLLPRSEWTSFVVSFSAPSTFGSKSVVNFIVIALKENNRIAVLLETLFSGVGCLLSNDFYSARSHAKF